MSAESDSPVEWAIQLLEVARSLEEVQVILRSSARAGVQAQGATVVRLEGDQCYYADEDAMSPMWKGQYFPVTSCISGWAMLHEQTVAISDIRIDSRIPQNAYRPTFVRSMLMVPIRAKGSPVGAIGAYWADEHRASDEEATTLGRLADAAGRALERVCLPADKSTPPADRNGLRALPVGTGERVGRD